MPNHDPAASAVAKTSPLHRTFSLLRFLADNDATGARIPDVCAHLSIHRVSAHRLLKTLIASGHVEQAPDLSYHLGFEAWALGLNYTQQFVPPVVTSALARVSETSEESVFLMRRAGTEGICIASHDGSYPLRSFVMHVGTRRPLGVGGTSVALLVQMPEDEANKIIQANVKEYARYGLKKRDVEVLVEEGRAQGYVFTKGAFAAETRTVAVPIPPSSMTAAQMSLGIVALESRIREPRRAKLLQALQTAAATLRDVIY